MQRLFALFACVLLVLSFGMGSMAHAMEPIGCVDSEQTAGIGHSEGDADEVSGDSDKPYPHHHGGCHGHHVAAYPESGDAYVLHFANRISQSAETPSLPGRRGDAALRPPQA